MTPRIALLIAAVTFSGCTDAPKSPAKNPAVSDPEESYFQARDNYIQQLNRQFEKAPGPIDERPALSELEKKMKEIVGPVDIEGFPRDGKINLDTLIKEEGFGLVDGLAFHSGSGNLFVTTQSILKRYLSESAELPKNLTELSKSGEFYRLVFTPTTAVTYYANIPVKSVDANSHVQAFLGVTAQDIGPIVPKDIFVFYSSGNRILAVYSPAKIDISEIPICRDEWETFDKKRSEAFAAYRSSDDKQALEDSDRYDQQGFEAYHRCYDREAKNQEFFEPLKKQVQSIVDRLQKNSEPAK